MEEPDTFEDAVQKSVLFYPNLFPSRKEVLNHLFFVIGNGFEWTNGRLTTDWPTEEQLAEQRKQTEEIRAEWHQAFEEALKDASPDDDGEMIDLGSLHEEFCVYPISKHSAICNIPDDVTTDWLAGAIETIEMARCLPESEEDSVERNSLGNLAKLKEIKEDLIHRFGAKFSF